VTVSTARCDVQSALARVVVPGTTATGTAVTGPLAGTPALAMRTTNTRPSSEEASTGSENVAWIGVFDVPNPSSALSTRVRSACAFGVSLHGAGSDTLPVAGSIKRSFGKGMTLFCGSNSATGGRGSGPFSFSSAVTFDTQPAAPNAIANASERRNPTHLSKCQRRLVRNNGHGS
jgi:hypothetical protein